MVPRFLRSETGAVTVDWTVLAATTIGLGVAAVGAVHTGQSALGEAIETSLTEGAVVALGALNAYRQTLATLDFSGGALTGWGNGRAGYSAALGDFLGPYAGADAEVTYDFTLPEGATNVAITFDLLLFDSWDGDSPTWSDAGTGGRGDGIAFSLNGTEIGFSPMWIHAAGAPSGTTTIDGVTYSYSLTRTQTDQLYTHTYGHQNTQDSRWSVTLTADTPPTRTLRLGVNGTANQGMGDESFGIDNVTMTAVTP